MRRLVVALLVVALALTLAACGGGKQQSSDAGSSTDAAAGAVAPPPATPGAQADSLVPDRSPTETVIYAALSSQAKTLPTEIQKRLDKKQPVLIFAFDKTQKSSPATRAEIDAAMKQFRGLIDLVAYDVGRYVSSDAETGDVKVDPKLSTDKEAAKVVTMLEQLKVTSTPTIIIVDQNGTVLWRSRGYTDRQLIEREILRATN